jgi:hypothetical protein
MAEWVPLFALFGSECGSEKGIDVDVWMETGTGIGIGRERGGEGRSEGGVQK